MRTYTKVFKFDNYGKDSDGNVIPCVTIRAQNIKLINTPNLQVTAQTVSYQVFFVCEIANRHQIHLRHNQDFWLL